MSERKGGVRNFIFPFYRTRSLQELSRNYQPSLRRESTQASPLKLQILTKENRGKAAKLYGRERTRADIREVSIEREEQFGEIISDNITRQLDTLCIPGAD